MGTRTTSPSWVRSCSAIRPTGSFRPGARSTSPAICKSRASRRPTSPPPPSASSSRWLTTRRWKAAPRTAASRSSWCRRSERRRRGDRARGVLVPVAPVVLPELQGVFVLRLGDEDRAPELEAQRLEQAAHALTDGFGQRPVATDDAAAGPAPDRLLDHPLPPQPPERDTGGGHGRAYLPAERVTTPGAGVRAGP